MTMCLNIVLEVLVGRRMRSTLSQSKKCAVAISAQGLKENAELWNTVIELRLDVWLRTVVGRHHDLAYR
jgi:hypothetical protein